MAFTWLHLKSTHLLLMVFVSISYTAWLCLNPISFSNPLVPPTSIWNSLEFCCLYPLVHFTFLACLASTLSFSSLCISTYEQFSLYLIHMENSSLSLTEVIYMSSLSIFKLKAFLSHQSWMQSQLPPQHPTGVGWPSLLVCLALTVSDSWDRGLSVLKWKCPEQTRISCFPYTRDSTTDCFKLAWQEKHIAHSSFIRVSCQGVL